MSETNHYLGAPNLAPQAFSLVQIVLYNISGRNQEITLCKDSVAPRLLKLLLQVTFTVVNS